MNLQARRAILATICAVMLAALPATAEPGAPESNPVVPEGDSIAAEPVEPLIEEDIEFEDDPADPWEPTNRVFFGFNQLLDKVLINPFTKGYRFVVPDPVRRAVRRAFVNLNSPSVLVNDVLQGRFKDAGVTLGRLVLNTTVGWGGLFDVGQAAGWEYHHADFGQTLALAGVSSGPYVVIPVFGPSTVRDGFGDLVDRMFQPLTYVLGIAPNLVLGGGTGLSLRDEKDEQLRALEESSVDFYAVLRSAYLQNREAEIWGHTYLDAESAARMATAGE